VSPILFCNRQRDDKPKIPVLYRLDAVTELIFNFLRQKTRFPRTRRRVKDGEIDAAYDMTSLSWGGDHYFSKYDIPLVSLGMQPHSANCVIIDSRLPEKSATL